MRLSDAKAAKFQWSVVHSPFSFFFFRKFEFCFSFCVRTLHTIFEFFKFLHCYFFYYYSLWICLCSRSLSKISIWIHILHTTANRQPSRVKPNNKHRRNTQFFSFDFFFSSSHSCKTPACMRWVFSILFTFLFLSLFIFILIFR